MTGTKEPRKRRQYTRTERNEILAAAEEIGLAEAARRHGVPQTTVSNWRNRDAGKSSTAAQSPAEEGTAIESNSSMKTPPPPPTVAALKPAAAEANLHKELFDRHRFYDLAEMKRRLATHLHWYNHGRTHHALGGLLVPADRYYGRAVEVLARIEAGAQREGDDLDMRERCLELFKVVSKNGAPEVWLLGQRLNVPLGTQ